MLRLSTSLIEMEEYLSLYISGFGKVHAGKRRETGISSRVTEAAPELRRTRE